MVLIEATGQRVDQRRAFGPQPAFGQLGEHPRIAFTVDQCREHGSAGHTHDAGRHRGQFDQRVFK